MELSLTPNTTLLLGVIGLLTLYFLYKLFSSQNKHYPPGPRGLSATLSALKAFKESTLHKQAKAWRDQYGELVLCQTVIGDFCFLNSARLVREMYVSKERELVTNDRPRTFSGWFMCQYQDILTSGPSDDPNWIKRRRLFHHAIKYYGDGVERFESTVQTELQRLASRIEARAGEEVDMDNVLTYSLLCVLTVLLTGTCPEPDSEMVRIMKEFDHAGNELLDPSVDGILGILPFLRFVPGTYYNKICHQVRTKRKILMDGFFVKAKETHTPGCQRGIIDVLLDEQLKGDNQWLTDGVIEGIIQDITGGGFVTSFCTLKAMILFLLHNPEVTRRIQKEIDDVMGQRPPSVADRSNLPYTEAAVMETLRCSSVVPLGVPHETKDSVMIDGFSVPKGCMVFANAWTIHRDPEVFSDPELFRPERFLDDVTGELLPPTHPARQSLLSFSVGKRSCPGENFARTRVFLYVTTLLQKFDVLPPVKHQLPSPDPKHYTNGLVLQPSSYHVIFRQRAEK